jgi:hypothetical protein
MNNLGWRNHQEIHHMSMTDLRIACKHLQPWLVGSAIYALSLPTLAEVKSLSSSELTETYIEDSTIIITPERNAPKTEQSTANNITIEPVDTEGEDIEALKINQNQLDGLETAFELSDDLLRNTNVALALEPPQDVDIETYQESITLPVADILQDERYRVPEGDFEFDYVGSDLGLSRDGQELTFSIGNLPGIDQINLPYAVDDGPLQITPREGGGFDLTIAIPQQD